jgi:glucokinase
MGATAVTPKRVVAVDLGGTKTLTGVVDRDGVVVRRRVAETPIDSQAALFDGLVASIDEFADDSIAAIGVGVPSVVDQRTGRAVSSVNIPLAGLDLRDRLRERFGVPVALDNDANAAAVAEHRFGAGRGTNHMIMLTLGTGIGGGLILNGRLYHGAIGGAGELGHMTIDIHGPPCQGTCPGMGHLEGLASGTAADHRSALLALEHPDGGLGRAAAAGREIDARVAVDVAAAEPGGDAADLLEELGTYLGAGIATLVNVFNPEVVVVGGGFARAGELLLEPARRYVAERALMPMRELVRIVPAALGVEAGLIGAAMLAFQALDEPL